MLDGTQVQQLAQQLGPQLAGAAGTMVVTGFLGEAGKSAWKGLAGFTDSLRKRFTGEKNAAAQEALTRLEEHPNSEDARAQLVKVVREEVAVDPAFAGELLGYLQEVELAPHAGDVEIIRFFTVCFDRPAFHDSLVNQPHRPLEAFDQAIEDTISALNTGTLRTRDGMVVLRGQPKMFLKDPVWLHRADEIVFLLRQIRQRYAEAVKTGDIKVYGGANDEIGLATAEELEGLRLEVISRFTALCQAAHVPAPRFTPVGTS